MIDALLFTFKWLAAGGLIVVGAVLAFVGLMAFPGTK